MSHLPNISQFFATHNFTYDSTEDTIGQFRRLVRQKGWTGTVNIQRQNAREGLSNAIAKDFNLKYGVDVNNLGAWKGLCEAIGLEPVPDNLVDCRAAVANCFVNIVDLVEGPKDDEEFVQRFESLDALRAYTISEGRFFPKENAYAGGVLRYLLREILGTYGGRGRSGGRGRGRGQFRSRY